MKTFKIAAFSALLACGAAFAQQEPPMQQPADEYPAQPPAQTSPSTTESSSDATQATGSQLPEFKTVDANGDGQLSRDEAAAAPGLSQVWSDADADKNGSLSSSEYDRARQAMEGKGEQR